MIFYFLISKDHTYSSIFFKYKSPITNMLNQPPASKVADYCNDLTLKFEMLPFFLATLMLLTFLVSEHLHNGCLESLKKQDLAKM